MSSNSSFVMFVMAFRTKIFTAFEIEIRGSFLLIVKYHVKNTCTNFKQNLLRREYVRKSFICKNLPSECNVCNVELPIFVLLARKPSVIIRDKDKENKKCSAIHFPLKNCNDLSTLKWTFSLVVFQFPDTDI